MAIDNIEEKIKRARAAGYNDTQIETYLKSQGLSMPKKTLETKVMDAAGKVTDAVGLRKASDTIAQNINNIAHPRLMQETGAPLTTLRENLEAGRDLGLTVGGGPSGGGIALTAGKQGGKVAAKATAKAAVKTAAKVAEKASDIITPIEPGVQTVLKGSTSGRVTERFNHYVSQAEKAVQDYSLPTPLELAGQEGERALQALATAKRTIAERKNAVTGTLAHLDVKTLPSDARKMLQTLAKDRLGLVWGTKGFASETGRVATVSDPADLKLIREVDQKLSALQKEPSFQKIDDTIDYIQDLLFKRDTPTAVPMNTKVKALLKGVARNLNDGLKGAAAKSGNTDYGALNASYGDYADLYKTLNKGLGLDGNKGASLMKQLFSPNGTMPRKLFNAIKEKTGIDLVQEATLAKFAMENIGDVRQASLLEQVLRGGVPGKTGLIQIAAERLLNKVQDPIGKARRIIKKSGK